MVREISLATGHPSINIIFSVRCLTVMRCCGVVVADELFHGAATFTSSPALFQPAFPAWFNLSHPILIRWSQMKDTPSLVVLQTPPYKYLVLTHSPKCLFRFYFRLLKAYFVSVRFKIRFQLFTVLPLDLF